MVDEERKKTTTFAKASVVEERKKTKRKNIFGKNRSCSEIGWLFSFACGELAGKWTK